MNPLIGTKIKAIFLSEGGGAIRFDLENEESLVVRADGDCCSHSWIEEIQGVDQILNSKIVSVENVDGIHETVGGDYNGQPYECLQFYGCKIISEKGYALIDYRNESNGYYGGNLSWPGEHFYGGVFDQNGSTENWSEVTA